MARYTQSICDILTQHNTNGGSLKDLNNLYSLGSEYVFGESAVNVLSSEYRRNFVIGFCLHYMFDEIGMETLPGFQIQLLERLFNNKDYIELVFDNLDKQIYKSYLTHIKDTRDNIDRKVSDDTDITRNETETRNFTDTNTKDLTNERTYNVHEASTGSDTSNKTGTQTNAKTGYDTDTIQHRGTDTVSIANEITTDASGTITNEMESATNVDVSTTVDPDPDNNGGHTTTTIYGDNNSPYKSTFTDNLKYTDTNENKAKQETWTVDNSRTRTIGQLAELPQSGVTGSDVIGSGSSNIMGAGSGSGSKYLSQANITDYQSAGNVTNGTGESTFGGVTFPDREFTNPSMSTVTNGNDTSVVHTPDNLKNTQVTEQEGQISVVENGKITTRQTGNKTDNTTETSSTQTNANKTTTEESGTNTTTFNDDTTDRKDYSSTNTLTNNLTDKITYGKTNATTGTQTDDQTGTDTVTHTGTGGHGTTGKNARDIDLDEDRTGHVSEETIEMNYETLVASTSLMNNIWSIFDSLFMQLI